MKRDSVLFARSILGQLSADFSSYAQQTKVTECGSRNKGYGSEWGSGSPHYREFFSGGEEMRPEFYAAEMAASGLQLKNGIKRVLADFEHAATLSSTA